VKRDSAEEPKEYGGEVRYQSLVLTHPSHCDKNVIKLFQTGIIIVTDRIIVKATTL
jgi:hypothetical protein